MNFLPFALFLVLLSAAPTTIRASDWGTIVLNIEPTKGYPRNSEGAFAQLHSGKLIFYYTQFYGGAADESPARIVGIESSDRGQTWSSPKTVIENSGGNNVMSVSLLRLQNGQLALFYLLKNSWIDCRPYVRFSDNDAETWSEPVQVTSAPGYFVLNNDRVVQTSTGRIIMPLAYHRSKRGDPHSSKSFDHRAIALWFYSDDNGRTWQESSSWWAMPVNSGTGFQEPGLVELENKKLLSWARTDQGTQYGFKSNDDGKTWTPPFATSLKSPVSPASIKRVPNSPNLLAIFNDHSGAFAYLPGKRTPLIAAISHDGGETWQDRVVIEDDPDGWYCYSAIHFTDDAILLAYCSGDSKVGGLNRLRLRRIGLNALTPQNAASPEAPTEQINKRQP